MSPAAKWSSNNTEVVCQCDSKGGMRRRPCNSRHRVKNKGVANLVVAEEEGACAEHVTGYCVAGDRTSSYARDRDEVIPPMH